MEIRKCIRFGTQRRDTNGEFRTVKQEKTREAIHFTLENYKRRSADFARYDRGEKFPS